METLESAINFVINILELQDTLTNRDQIQKQLNQSSGLDKLGSIVYRKHYVIGVNLWLSLDNNLISGEGAKFDQAFETTRRHLAWQKIQDKALTNIPDGYDADSLLGQIKTVEQTQAKNFTIGFLSF